MTLYHAVLFLLAATASGLVATHRSCPQHPAEAVVSCLAMGAAMLIPSPTAVLSAIAVLLASAGYGLRRRGDGYSALSALMMAAIMAALLAFNGSSICGAQTVPLIGTHGVTLLLIPDWQDRLVRVTAALMLPYGLLTLGMALRHLTIGPKRRIHAIETLLMGGATLGMAFPGF
tara:strand:+ start:263 stop:784 length:522 start_codon:yes stop_codon:yes gene_type:complete